jgi:hypothetical protein
MSPEEYIELVATRLRAEGAEVGTTEFRGVTALVGYRPKFRLRWMATRLNLFTVVIAEPVVTAQGLELFTNDALKYATSQKGRFRGLQNGVAAIPVLVGAQVDADAITYARTKLVRKFSAFAWPAAVDLSSGETYQHQGRVAIGGIYAGWMREQTAVALPKPTPASS